MTSSVTSGSMPRSRYTTSFSFSSLSAAADCVSTVWVSAFPQADSITAAIVTARSAPAHRRVINTLRSWNITVDETHFLGGMDKGRILETLRPHIFFDDQKHPHLDSAQAFTPSVHVPFGIANNRRQA